MLKSDACLFGCINIIFYSLNLPLFLIWFISWVVHLSVGEVHSPSLLYWMLARINVANYYLLETESQDAS